MPYGDRTGPRGFGPRTGRGLGRCLPEEDIEKDIEPTIVKKTKKVGESIVDKILGK